MFWKFSLKIFLKIQQKKKKIKWALINSMKLKLLLQKIVQFKKNHNYFDISNLMYINYVNALCI